MTQYYISYEVCTTKGIESYDGQWLSNIGYYNLYPWAIFVLKCGSPRICILEKNQHLHTEYHKGLISHNTRYDLRMLRKP